MESVRTPWKSVAWLILAAVVGAFQVGKAIIAVPLLQGSPLHLGLRESGWVLSAIAVLGALLAMPFGLVIARVEGRRVVVAALLTIALASAAGAFAPGAATLIAARTLEGLAVVGTLIAAPSLIGRLVAARDRDLAFALSSTAMPAGIALMLLFATAAQSAGWAPSWRVLWLANAALAALCALAVRVALPTLPALGSAYLSITRAAAAVLAAPGPRLLCLLFATYTVLYFAFVGFLPVLLRDLLALSAKQAGYASAFVVVANVLGNVAAGALLRRGVPLWRIVACAFVAFAALVPLLFHLRLPAPVAIAIAFVMVGGFGMIPGSLTAASARVAPVPGLMAATIGLMFQGSYIGQLIGPAAAGTIAQRGG